MNPRPSDYKSDALPAELRQRYSNRVRIADWTHTAQEVEAECRARRWPALWKSQMAFHSLFRRYAPCYLLLKTDRLRPSPKIQQRLEFRHLKSKLVGGLPANSAIRCFASLHRFKCAAWTLATHRFAPAPISFCGFVAVVFPV